MAAKTKGVSPLPGSFKLVAGTIIVAAIICLSVVVEGDLVRHSEADIARMNGVLELKPDECLYRDSNHSILIGDTSLAAKWKNVTFRNDSDSVAFVRAVIPLYNLMQPNNTVSYDLRLDSLKELKAMFPNTKIEYQNKDLIGKTFTISTLGHKVSNHFITHNVNVTIAEGNIKWTGEMLIDGVQKGNSLQGTATVNEVVQLGLCRSNATESN